MSDMDDLRKMLDAPPIGGLTMPELYSPSMTSFKMPVIPSIWETQAKLFMEGLKAQVKELEASLKPNQELAMICWHGHEKFQVLSVSMPSKNVVALNCRDAEGDVTQVTGHMNSVTFPSVLSLRRNRQSADLSGLKCRGNNPRPESRS